MVGRSSARVAARGLLSPGVQRPTFAEPPYLAEQEATVQVALRGQCRDASGGCRRPETPRCRDRFPEYSAYLGPDSTAASPYSLRRAGWRIIAGSPTLDSGAQPLLPSGKSA